MKLQMSSLKFDADKKLIDFIQKKADKLDTFYDNIIDGEVNMKVDNGTDQDNKVVEIKLNVPGSTLFAKEYSKSFEAAADSAVEALRRQLKKFKEKQFKEICDRMQDGIRQQFNQEIVGPQPPRVEPKKPKLVPARILKTGIGSRR